MTKPTIIQLALMGSAVALFLYLGHRTAATIVGSLAGLVLLLALVSPGTLHTLQEAVNRAGAWVATGIGLGLLTIVYFTVFWLGALWLKLLRIDPLNRAFPGDGGSNWIDRVGYGKDKLIYGKPYTLPHAAPRSKGTPR
jgi:hypothetical protein